MANLSVKDSTINLIAGFEGFAGVAFWDYKQYSIGYGTGTMPNGKSVQAGDRVTKAEAISMLKRDVQTYANSVNRLVTASINQNQFDALTSFCYNLGAGNLEKSGLLRQVNANPTNYAAIRNEFKKWVTAGGVTLPGLVARRQKEASVYENGSLMITNYVWVILVLVFAYFFKK